MGALRDQHRLDLRLQRDRPRQGDLQPDLRPGPDQLPVQVAARRCFTLTGWPPSPTPRSPPGAPGSPWRLAWRRLRRNRVALGFLGALRPDRRLRPRGAALGRPRRPHRARTRPTRWRRSRSTAKSAKSSTSKASRSARVWFGAGGKFFLGADGRLGRDEMVRLMYGGRTSLFIGIVSALITTVLATILGLLAGYYRGWTDTGDLAGAGRDLGLPGAAAGDRARHRRSRVGGLQIGPLAHLRRLDLDPDPDHRRRLDALHGAADPRRGALPAREGVRRGRGRPGRRLAAGDVRRAAAQPLVDDHRLLHPQHRQQHAARVGALLPRRRRAAARTPPGAR